MQEDKVKKLKYGYSKKSFDNLVIKRVNLGTKLEVKKQDLRILKAKEDKIKKDREQVSNGLPSLIEDRITFKSGLTGGLIGAGIGLGVVATGMVDPDALQTSIPQIIATGALPGGVLGLSFGNFVASTPRIMHFIENKKLSVNFLKEKVTEKRIESLENKVEALDETIKDKYERVSDLVHDERYEELSNIKKERNMKAVAVYFRQMDEEDAKANENVVEKEVSNDLPKLNIRPYDPAVDGVEQFATLEELNDGYTSGCTYETDNDFEA